MQRACQLASLHFASRFTGTELAAPRITPIEKEKEKEKEKKKKNKEKERGKRTGGAVSAKIVSRRADCSRKWKNLERGKKSP